VGFLYDRCERLSAADLANKYYIRKNILLEIFEWLCLTWQFASISMENDHFWNIDISQSSEAT